MNAGEADRLGHGAEGAGEARAARAGRLADQEERVVALVGAVRVRTALVLMAAFIANIILAGKGGYPEGFRSVVVIAKVGASRDETKTQARKSSQLM